MKDPLLQPGLLSAVENFDAKAAAVDRPKGEPVTFWLPTETKKKYDRIQKVSKKHFSNVLKDVLIKSIDLVHLDEDDSKAS